MLEILQFIFSSFWIWLGTLILVGLPIALLTEVRLITINRVGPKQLQGKED